MGFFSRDKGDKPPAKFGGGWDKDKKAVKDKIDKAVRDREKRDDTGGKGKGK